MSVVEVDLGRENNLVARNTKRLQGGAEVFLARAVRVAVGGVEEVDAKIERMRDHLRRLLQGERPQLEVVERLAIGHAADADAADFDVCFSEFSVFHDIVSFLSFLVL